MKKGRKLIILLAVFLSLVFLLIIKSSFLLKNPFDSSEKFNYPYRTFTDKNGNFYLLDNTPDGYKRLLKINSAGDLVFELAGGSRNESGIYSITKLAISDSGIIFLNNVVYNIDDQLPERCEIKKFSPEGDYISTLVRYEYDQPMREKINTEYINSAFLVPYMQCRGDDLYYYYFDSPDTISLYRIDTKNNSRSKLFEIASGSSQNDMAGIDPGKIYISDNDGKFFRITEKLKKEEMHIITSGKGESIYPYPLAVDSSGDLIFNELYSQRLFLIRNNNLFPYLNYRNLVMKEKPHYRGMTTFYDIAGNSVVLTDRIEKNFFTIDIATETVRVIYRAKLSLTDMVMRWLYWLLMPAALIVLTWLMHEIYVTIFSRRLPLGLKNGVVYGSILVASVYSISMYVFSTMQKYAIQEKENRFLLLSQIASTEIDGDLVERIDQQKDIKGNDFLTLSAKMKLLTNQNSDSWNSELSMYIYKKTGLVYSLLDMNGYDFLYPYPIPESYGQTVAKGNIAIHHFADENGEWTTATAPVKNSKGDIVAIVEVGSNMETLSEIKNNIRISILKRIGIALVLFGLVLGVLTYFMITSIRKLRLLTDQVANKNYEVEAHITSKDEIEDLACNFNVMVRQIRSNIEEIKHYAERVEKLKNANARFVPAEFLSYLEKTSIADVRLGDQVNRDMTILFADIRNFTRLSERMTPQQNFNFLNSFLNRFGPIVRENGGFIDKYIGDCIMALFPASADDALKSAVMMRNRLKEYNSQRVKVGYEAINIGIGIHTGNMMLGIIGERERYEGTVISDAVNLGARLESLTKIYNIGIIVSSNVVMAASTMANFNYRFIDYIKVKGKTEPVLIYEVFDEDVEMQIELKNRTKQKLEDGIHLLIKGQILDAQKLFLEIKNSNPGDGVIDLYLKRCEDFIAHGFDYDQQGFREL